MDHEHNADINDLLSEFRKQHEENSVEGTLARLDRMPRRIIQISTVYSERWGHVVHALCSDGTVWSTDGDIWIKTPDIPQEAN